jgi:uncharacterized SAM-binding protein YcdF (DUF218 family)
MFEIIKAIIIPSNLILILSVAGGIFFLFKIKKRIAGGLIGAALILYLFFGTGIISFWLLGTLETRYPRFKEADGLKGVRKIVVLTGYAETDPALPPSSEVNFASAFRVLETRRIFNFLPGANVLITGGGDVPTIMRNLMVSLGIPQSRIILENQSSNTLESAIQVQKMLKGKKFILVTSAGHMPRAMGAFRKLGMNPIPAPTNFISVKKIRLIHFFPSPLHLEYSDLAVHEYFGIAWYRLTNRS